MNIVMIVGNVGRDPEIRTTPNGSKVANFSIATSERWKDKDGEKAERTTWNNCIAWGPLVTVIENYVTKGSKLAIEGKLESRKWTDREGNERTAVEVNVQRLELLSPRKERGATDDEEEAPAMRRPKPKPKPAVKEDNGKGYDLDDEIPW